MGINNKEELLSKLADDMFQGIDQNGDTMIFSLIESEDYNRMREINRAINIPIQWLTQQPTLSVTPMRYLQMCIAHVELNTPEEVAHFLWQAGYMFGILNGTIDAINKYREDGTL